MSHFTREIGLDSSYCLYFDLITDPMKWLFNDFDDSYKHEEIRSTKCVKISIKDWKGRREICNTQLKIFGNCPTLDSPIQQPMLYCQKGVDHKFKITSSCQSLIQS